MLKMKKISEVYEMRVFTDNGEYFGDIEEAIIQNTKIFGWRVRATKNSFFIIIQFNFHKINIWYNC